MTRRRWVRRALALSGVMGITAGTVVVVGVTVVRRHLLNEALYTAALVDADAYERVYTEVLPDPVVADATEDLIGDLDLRWVDPATARIYATNALRWAVPPSVLQRGTETLIAGTLAYLRGDRPRVEAEVPVRRVLARVEPVAIRQARVALAGAATEVTASIEEYRARVATATDRLRRGRVPATLPLPPGGAAPARVAEVLREAVGVRAGTRLAATVEALTVAGNPRDAAISALSAAVRDHAERAARRLRAELDRRARFDVVERLEGDGATRRVPVVAELNTVRDLVSWFRWPTFAAGVILTAGGAVLVWWSVTDRRRRLRVIAAGLMLAGVVTGGAWLAVRHLIDPPLAAATGAGPGTWALPPSLASLVRDVEAGLAGSLQRSVLRLAALPALAGAALAAVSGIGALAGRPSRAVRVAVAAAAGVASVAAVLGVAVWAGRPAGADDRACNGHPELCDRRYDEVVYAATHNAMSSPDTVFMWPEHDDTMREQLDAGIRALLIDAHFWTDVVSAEQLMALDRRVTRAAAEWVLSTGGERLRGRPGVYLCHNHCVFGARPFVDGLRDVRAFLDENPDEVVTLIVQDEVPRPALLAAFKASGLDRYAHAGRSGRWPTLGELIDAGTRLVVFAEHHGAPTGWLRPAFEEMQDTPFGFPRPEAMTCAPNRGPRDAPLFLLNHWVSPPAPDRRAAAVVNERAFVVERARRCGAERGRQVNVVAVDFSTIGDVIGAVDALNHVDP